MAMILAPLFEPYINKSPLSVMARATIEHALGPADLDELFDQEAIDGYTKELLFSTTVDLMSLVVCNKALHVQGAFQQMKERIPVRLKSVYEKLQHIETHVSAALVRHTGQRCADLVGELGAACQPLLPGYRVRIIDGNHLAATQKRLKVTRQHTAGPLPGQTLAILDPATLLVTDVLPCADGHAQERSLFDQLLPRVQANDVWIADRNFCTIDLLDGIHQRQASFVIRRHGNTTVEAQDNYGEEVETATGWASERPAWLCRDGARVREVRSVRVRLKTATAAEEWEVEILTNLSAAVADAARVGELYLKRWQIEGVFHELTMSLQCEVNTLGYPKAALFGFCVAVAAYNVLAVIKAALRAVHGEEKVRRDVSGYYIALEWSLVFAGMMIALPAEEWEVFGSMSAAELAACLRDWASRIDLERIKKSPPRKPTKTKPERIKDKSPHLSTARLLEEDQQKKKQATRRSKP